MRKNPYSKQFQEAKLEYECMRHDYFRDNPHRSLFDDVAARKKMINDLAVNYSLTLDEKVELAKEY